MAMLGDITLPGIVWQYTTWQVVYDTHTTWQCNVLGVYTHTTLGDQGSVMSPSLPGSVLSPNITR